MYEGEGELNQKSMIGEGTEKPLESICREIRESNNGLDQAIERLMGAMDRVRGHQPSPAETNDVKVRAEPNGLIEGLREVTARNSSNVHALHDVLNELDSLI